MKITLRIVFLPLLIISINSFAQKSSKELTAKIEAMAKVGACYSPSFSPDGSEIAFISNISGIPQLWKIPSTGGWPIQLTNFNDPVSNAIWSPKGNKIAFQLAPGGGMNSQIYTIKADGSEIKQITSGGKSNNWMGNWSDDGNYLSYSSNQNNPSGMDSHLYNMLTKMTELSIVNQGIGRITDIGKDNDRFLLSRVASRGSNDLYLIDKESNETLLTKHSGPGSFYGEFSPNGEIYISSNLNRDKIAFGKIKNRKIEVLSERGDSELQNFIFNESGSMALLVWNVAGKNEISLFDIQNQKELKTLDMPVEQVGGGDFSSDDRYFLFTGSGSTEPANVWLYDFENDTFTKLTDSPHPGINLEELIAPELVKFKSFDGLELSGWLYQPAVGNSPYPTVISYHGGPEGQSRPSFSYTFQALLSQGIAVFSPNVRGSSGFGKEFVNLDNGALRTNGIKDIEACYNYVVESGFADKSKVGIMGGSYGGYMVMAGITEYPDMFAAAANLFGVVNFITFFEETEPWMAAISKVEYGDPDTEADMLRALSPINKVAVVKTPTIVLHGANDTNVPVVEAEQVVENLKKRNIPVEYILFQDEGHGWRKTSNKVMSTVSIVNWFKLYLLEK
ncbi:S9 family peptidase [uncultured Eudoraea sp.]|uniref:S9 family peptidase n=1 Tax=uncultured Eudoraea sp. TaxID=1035614 RepID=UPI002624F219|nr:S9 family peptidase [uncultured Eudoraea sp.]